MGDGAEEFVYHVFMQRNLALGAINLLRAVYPGIKSNLSFLMISSRKGKLTVFSQPENKRSV